MASLFVQLQFPFNPSKIELDLTNGPLSKLLELRYSGVRVRSVGPVGDFLDSKKLFTVLYGLRAFFFVFRTTNKKFQTKLTRLCLPLSSSKWLVSKIFSFHPWGNHPIGIFIIFFTWVESAITSPATYQWKTRPVSTICCVSGNRSWAWWSSLVPWLEHALDHGLYWRPGKVAHLTLTLVKFVWILKNYPEI